MLGHVVDAVEVSEVSDGSLISKSIPFDSSKCLICDNKSYKKCKEMNNASSFDSRDGIKKAAEAIDGKRILHIIAFIHDRLNTNKVSFWEPLKQLKIKTFASTKKKITLKSTNEKVISIDADRNLFGHLLIVANSREVNHCHWRTVMEA